MRFGDATPPSVLGGVHYLNFPFKVFGRFSSIKFRSHHKPWLGNLKLSLQLEPNFNARSGSASTRRALETKACAALLR